MPLLYAAKLHAIHGEPETGKGWLAHLAACELIAQRKHVLYVDFEDEPATAVERQRALGTGKRALLRYFHYLRPDEPLATGWDDLADLLGKHRFKLAILDGLTEAYTLNGLDPYSNADAARWLQLLPRRLCRRGVAVLQVDHVVKDRAARGRYALGGQHKLAGVDVAYSLRVVEPFGRDRDGLARLHVVKDRPGWIQRHAVGKNRQIATVRFSSADGDVSIALAPPEFGGDFRPTELMCQISRLVAGNAGLSQRAILGALEGNQNKKLLALELLVSEGYVQVRASGKGKPHKHYSKRVFHG